jgi:hypothetical protein
MSIRDFKIGLEPYLIDSIVAIVIDYGQLTNIEALSQLLKMRPSYHIFERGLCNCRIYADIGDSPNEVQIRYGRLNCKPHIVSYNSVFAWNKGQLYSALGCVLVRLVDDARCLQLGYMLSCDFVSDQ